MNQLNKDEIFVIALMLDFTDILSLCRANKRINQFVCQNKHFWIRKLKQDYNVIYLCVSPNKLGNPKLYYQYLQKYRDDPNNGMFCAAFGGHKDIIKLMIEKGTKSGTRMDWNQGMYYAAKSGHVDIIKLMIEKGADGWNRGMYGAAKGGHVDIVKFMIEKGAKSGTRMNWDEGMDMQQEVVTRIL